MEAIVLPGKLCCAVVDRSATGLRLRFDKPYAGPANFVVVLVGLGQAFTVSARWTKDAEIGVLIGARCDLKGLVPSAFAEARAVWSHRKG